MRRSKTFAGHQGPSHTRTALGSLATMPHGSTARVIKVNGTGPVARRLMEMGVIPGAEIRFVRVAPLGDPIQVLVSNYHLALRRSEAQAIVVMCSR